MGTEVAGSGRGSWGWGRISYSDRVQHDEVEVKVIAGSGGWGLATSSEDFGVGGDAGRGPGGVASAGAGRVGRIGAGDGGASSASNAINACFASTAGRFGGAFGVSEAPAGRYGFWAGDPRCRWFDGWGV